MLFVLALLACSDTTKIATDDTAGGSDTATSDTSDTADTSVSTDTSDTSDTTDTSDTQDTGSTRTYPGGPGDLDVVTETSRVAGADVTWYRPDAPGPYPVVIWSHGFARGPEQHADAARWMASWGFLVATPKLPSFADHEANGAFLANDLVPAAILESGQDDPPIALVGHSAGGLASLVAASMGAGDTYVGLDAVDAGNLGTGVDGDVGIPALLFHGEAGACNANGSSESWTLGGEQWDIEVVGANHCDFETNTDGLCTFLCGDEDAARQELILTFTTAWLLDHLGVFPTSEWGRGGARAEAERSAGRVNW